MVQVGRKCVTKTRERKNLTQRSRDKEEYSEAQVDTSESIYRKRAKSSAQESVKKKVHHSDRLRHREGRTTCTREET